MYKISENRIPLIGSFCFGLLSLVLISANKADISRTNRYGDRGHPCRIPEFWVL